MRRTLFITLAFISAHAHAKELVCFTVSSITLNNMGQQIEHEITDPDGLKNPENYTIFDLTSGTTTLFWLDPDGNKGRDVDKLKMVNNSLYVGDYDVGPDKLYTVYMFEKDFGNGLLVEDDFVASFRCERIDMRAAEEKYSIPFSEFKETS